MRFLILLLLMAGSAEPSAFEVYANSKYGYSVAYPLRTLVPQGELGSGDGQRFESKDKRFSMAVWGGYNALDRTLAGECDQHIAFERKDGVLNVTYKATKSDWCVFSGLKGSTIVYEKTLLQEGV